MKLGFFDSGIGGVGLLKEVMSQLPNQDYAYFADNKGHPYGDKEKSFILDRSSSILNYFQEHGCDLFVMACNTATASAINELRAQYSLPIVGLEPYINIINQQTDQKTWGVLLTPLTASSDRFLNLIKKLDPQNKINICSAPGLADLIERYAGRWQQSDFMKDLDKLLQSYSIPNEVQGLIMGCTHYDLIRSQIEQLLRIDCLSPNHAVALRIGQLLKNNISKQNPVKRLSFFQSKVDLMQLKALKSILPELQIHHKVVDL